MFQLVLKNLPSFMTGEVLRVNLPKIDEHLILLDVNLSPSFLLNVEGTVDMAYAS